MHIEGHYRHIDFRRFYASEYKIQTEGAGVQYILKAANGSSTTVYCDKGRAVRQVTRIKGKLHTDEMFGEYRKEFRNGKVEGITRFKSGSLCCRHGLSTAVDTVFNVSVKLKSWYSRGALYKQIARYDNKKIAYEFTRGSKKPLVIYRKNGMVWAEIKPFQLRRTPDKGILSNDKSRLLINTYDYSFVVYDLKGEVENSGQTENRQRQGAWVIDGKPVYYLSGVVVPEGIFKDDPEKWNADEVLGIDNAQLRASLLKKFTYERLVQRKQGKVIDTDTTDGKDNSIIEFVVDGKSDIDRIMHILKVKCPTTGTYYALRIPPEISKCEIARSWTFGVEVDDKGEITPENIVRFEQET